MTYRQGDVREVAAPERASQGADVVVHLADVGRAFLLCIVSTGLPGMYNITGDGVLSGAQLLRELGWRARYRRLEALRDTLDGRAVELGES